MESENKYVFKIGDWITLKETNIIDIKNEYKNREDEFEQRYKYLQKVVNIESSRIENGYIIYSLEPGNFTMYLPNIYRLATDKEIKTAKLKDIFQKNFN
jgi:hypothetical protein